MCMQISMCLRGVFTSFTFIEGDGLPKLPYYHTHLIVVSDATTIATIADAGHIQQ